jgi:hypothetical protein
MRLVVEAALQRHLRERHVRDQQRLGVADAYGWRERSSPYR